MKLVHVQLCNVAWNWAAHSHSLSAEWLLACGPIRSGSADMSSVDERPRH